MPSLVKRSSEGLRGALDDIKTLGSVDAVVGDIDKVAAAIPFPNLLRRSEGL